MTISPNQLPDDLDGLKRIIAALVQDAVATQAEIAKLRFQLARYRRAEFGRSSAKLARDAQQLELAIETLGSRPSWPRRIEAATEAQKPARRPLPEHLPGEDVTHPVPCTRPSCGGVFRRIGEDVTETLDYLPDGSS